MTERDNATWLQDLRSPGKCRTTALADLRKILLRGLTGALKNWVRQDTREFLSLCEDFIQEALLIILKHLDDFQGLSRFTTWAHKISVRVALSELRRARWKDYSLTATDEPGQSSSVHEPGSPDREQERVEGQMMLDWMKKVMREELTTRQQRALKAAAFDGISADALSKKLGTTRNALYKLLHDARLKLKKRMLKEGFMKVQEESDPDSERKPPFEVSNKGESRE
ncbi:MAG: sigma-70 family RNA polymerase sigma factor [Spirochaetales bacterium]|nr:sigma-70 family RNA polymerase sigma factor [Spirochaetales bacterium]